MVDERYEPVVSSVVEPVDTGRNPWLAVLWILAAVLLGAGGFLLTQTAEGAGSEVVPVLVLPIVLGAVAPWFIGTGLAAVVGAVFVQALRWRR